MRIIVASLLFLALSGQAFAGVLKCSFTEPFITITFDSATGVVTSLTPDDADPATGELKPKVIMEGAALRRLDSSQRDETFYLQKGEQVILEIRVNGQGSDGMSEMMFPFEGIYSGWTGGCESDKAPAYDLYEVFNDLGLPDDQW